MLQLFLVVFMVAAAIAFWLTPRQWSLWHTGVHTEYAGSGRVWFISFFRGRGYVVVLRRGRGRDGRPLDEPGWRPNIEIPGFTIMIRTAKSSCPRSQAWGKPVRWFRVTRNGNGAVV